MKYDRIYYMYNSILAHGVKLTSAAFVSKMRFYHVIALP